MRRDEITGKKHLNHSLWFSIQQVLNVKLSLVAVVIIGFFSIEVKGKTIVNRNMRDIQISTNNEGF